MEIKDEVTVTLSIKKKIEKLTSSLGGARGKIEIEDKNVTVKKN